MFGSSNNQNQNQTNNGQPGDAPAPDSHGFTMDPAPNDAASTTPTLPTEPTASPFSAASSAPHLDETNSQPPADSPPADTPAPDIPAPDNGSDEGPTSLPPANSTDDPGDNDLLAIKQQALSQLSPIVNHLDQSPEEKFQTLMMMIQANDNQDLIKEAYEAAQQIPDEKVKSQALLDVVNEINYFTQKKSEN